MVRAGAVLGGEQSGHVIFRQFATTGDGLLTALRILEIARDAGAGLDELTAGLEIYPQRLQNVRVRERRALHELAEVAREIEECRAGVRFRGARAGALFGHRAAGPRDGGRTRPGARGRIHRSHRHGN
jgi:phosphoglucosamine mutase